MTIFSFYPIEKYNRGMGGNSNFARPMLPTYRGCTVNASSSMLTGLDTTQRFNMGIYKNAKILNLIFMGVAS